MKAVRLAGAGVGWQVLAGLVDGAPGAASVAGLYGTGLWGLEVWLGLPERLWPDHLLELLAVRPLVVAQPFLLWGLIWCLWRFCWLYFGSGRTPGMRLAGLEVVDREGAPPQLGVCALRSLGEVLSLLCLGLGALWALVSAERRTWAELLSGSYLVRR